MTTFANTVKAAIRFSVSGETLVNTLWFRNLGEWGQADAEGLAEELSEWAYVNYVSILHESVEYVDTTVYDMRSPDSWAVVNTDGNGTQGGSTGSPASLASAMTVTFITNRIGRSYRGRNYISGWDEALVGNRQFTPQAVSDALGAYNALPAAAAVHGFTHVVASRIQNGIVLEEGVTTPILTYRPNLTIYSQKNRTRG